MALTWPDTCHVAFSNWLFILTWMLTGLPRGQHIALAWPETCYMVLFGWLVSVDVALTWTVVLRECNDTVMMHANACCIFQWALVMIPVVLESSESDEPNSGGWGRRIWTETVAEGFLCSDGT